MSGSLQPLIGKRLRSGIVMTALAYIAAALAEIAGCFGFWAWLRLDKSPGGWRRASPR